MSPEPEQAPAPRQKGGATKMMAVAGLVALVTAALGIGSRIRTKNHLRDEAVAASVPTVTVFVPEQSSGAQELTLPGSVEAFTEAPIHARASGYVKKFYVDLGARVKKGQRLADIEAPEVDQQLSQARAQVGTAQANEDLAKITWERLQKLVDTDAVSRQEVDAAKGAYAARQADTESAKANLRRLQQLVGFETVEAPFDGLITARDIDVGQLVDAGSTTATPLFRIATTGTLRVFVEVPEASARAAVAGVPVDLTVAERPGQRYPGTIVRTANAIDPANRTLRVEVDLENGHGEILPGAFAQVHLKPPPGMQATIVPISAMLFRAEGPRIATLGADSKAVLSPITIGRDFGSTIEITSGIPPGAQVIDSPPDSLVDGQQVRAVQRKPTPAAAPAGAPAKPSPK